MSTRLLTIVSLSLALVPAVSGAAETKGFVLTTDFSTGELSVVDLSTREVRVDVAQPPVPSSDARIRWHGGLIYVVNRTGSQSANNIQVIDPTQGYRTVRQFSTGSGSNPSDIAFASPGKAYVSLFGSPNLLVVNPMTGGTIKTISLSAFADADGNPEADRMVRIGRWLYVSLERLVNFAPTETSLVAVIDTQADTVLDVDPSRPGKQAIVLTGRNPVTSFEFDRRTSRLLIGCAGQYGALDGGIEVLDPFTFRSLGYAITEAALSGDVGDVAWNGPGHSYAIVSDVSTFRTRLVSWSAVTHTRLAVIDTTTDFGLADCALNDRGELYLCKNSLSGTTGLRVFSTATDQLIAGTLGTGLPPFQIAFDAENTDIAAVPSLETTLTIEGPFPNPARDHVRLSLALARTDLVHVDIFDIAGRRVRALVHEALGPGANEIVWDLRDSSRRRVKPAVYWVRANVEAGSIVRRIVVEH